MNAKLKKTRTTQNKEVMYPTGRAIGLFEGQIDLLENLLWRKMLSCMTPELREMLDVHTMLAEAGLDLATGKQITFNHIQQIVERAEFILTELKA